MSRNGVERRSLAALALVAGLLPGALAAQGVSSAQVTGIELAEPVRQSLDQIEEQWLQWIVQNDEASAERLADSLLDTARQLGMSRLPDLSAGAVTQALEAAGRQDFDRARWSLAAAERFDPGRPETAFVEAQVARLAGDWPAAGAAFARAWPRLFLHEPERTLMLHGLLFWALVLLLLTGGLFVAVQMATKGGRIFQEIAGVLGRRLPGPVAFALTVVALLWPLALPRGVLWLALYWSVLLWGHASRSERVVLVMALLLLGFAPLLVNEQRQRVAVTLSPPAQAMESLQQRRLYGGLFTDLGVLRSVLPESIAVKHMLADFHRSLGQWDMARALYRQVLENEPENTSALLNLGAYYFFKEDFGTAIQHFQNVATLDPRNAAAYFNLSQAYSESYRFDEMKSSQDRAREIDNERVSSWLQRSDQRVVTSSGGLARIPEVRRELRGVWSQGPSLSRLELFRKSLPVLVALSLLLVAGVLHLTRRRAGGGAPAPIVRGSRWGRALVPGFSAAESGEGGRAFVSLLVPAALALLPLLGEIGFRAPWRYDAGNLVAWVVAILGLLLYLGLRLRRELHDI